MPILQTERLNLRRLKLDDADFILELLNEPAFLENVGDKGVRDRAGAEKYLLDGPLMSYRQHGFGLFRVELNTDATPIGICGLLKRDTLDDADLGFALLSRFESRGYATEAAAAALAYGFETLGLPRVVAITIPGNRGSIAVLEKIGLRFERLIDLPGDGAPLRLYGRDRNDTLGDGAPVQKPRSLDRETTI